jgi:hypothetical protein
VILEIKTKEGAQILKGDTAKEEFAKNFGEDVRIKPRSHPVLVEHVPISFQPDTTTELRKAEDLNSLPDYAFLSARWIKPPHRRSPGQKVAHLIVNAMSPESANHIIRTGIILAGKRVYGRKLLQESQRCFKCQHIGVTHMAADCLQKTDICATCTGPHRAADCTVVDPREFQCPNCDGGGHTSGDRECPSFIAACKRFAAHNEVNKYRFYPVGDDASTWMSFEEERQQREAEIPNEGFSERYAKARESQRDMGGRYSGEDEEWMNGILQDQEPEEETAPQRQQSGTTQSTLKGWVTSQQRRGSKHTDSRDE